MARRKTKKPKTAGEAAIAARKFRQIANPDWAPDKDGEKGFPKQIVAAIDVRESAVEVLYSRGALSVSQKMAADRFRELWEAAGGKAKGIDYSQDRVDGGPGDPVTSKLEALHQLKRVRQLVGLRGYHVLESICGDGKSLVEITPHKRERLTMADNLRADLDDVGSMWGYTTRRRRA